MPGRDTHPARLPRMTATEDPRRAQLRRLRLIAVAMLLAMVAGFVTSHAMGNQGVWAWVSAFCEAATVGALADWFAVVALFRYLRSGAGLGSLFVLRNTDDESIVDPAKGNLTEFVLLWGDILRPDPEG